MWLTPHDKYPYMYIQLANRKADMITTNTNRSKSNVDTVHKTPKINLNVGVHVRGIIYHIGGPDNRRSGGQPYVDPPGRIGSVPYIPVLSDKLHI